MANNLPINLIDTFPHFKLCVDSVHSNLSVLHKLHFCCTAVTAGQPSSTSDDPEAVSLIGNIKDEANQINQKEILWGVSPLLYWQN